ncbi:MAG TPA: DUF5996 family protein [Sphingomonas sp.]|nr:DUF5996 family protein [Sphingomonas sp.]
MSALPALDWPAWRETALHLQLMTQVVGKIRLALTPWVNHGWHVPLYVTSLGLGTSLVPSEAGPFEIELDLIDHQLVLRTSAGGKASLALRPGTIADFHAELMAVLGGFGIAAPIVTLPNEMPDPVRFPEDRAERPYDREAVHRFHAALAFTDAVFKQFRTAFLGKVSPVHFFWGSFDLAVTRFSGRPAPPHPGGVPGLPDAVTREAYSHEVSSAGFWPGNDSFPRPAFYSYAYPVPPGFGEASIPAPAYFNAELGEFLLDYDAVRAAADPAAMLTDFLESTYAVAADLGGWDRGALECTPGVPRRPRKV